MAVGPQISISTILADLNLGCVYSTGTGTGNFALGVPVTSPPKNLEIFEENFRDQSHKIHKNIVPRKYMVLWKTSRVDNHKQLVDFVSRDGPIYVIHYKYV